MPRRLRGSLLQALPAELLPRTSGTCGSTFFSYITLSFFPGGLFKYCICVIPSVVTRSRRSPCLSFHACSCSYPEEMMMAGSLDFLPNFRQGFPISGKDPLRLFYLSQLCRVSAIYLLFNRYAIENQFALTLRNCTIFWLSVGYSSEDDDFWIYLFFWF